MHGIDRPAGRRRGNHRVQAAGENAEATLFAFHIDGAVGPKCHQMRVATGFCPHHHSCAHHKDQRHGPQDGAALAAIANGFAERQAQRCRDHEYRQHLHKIGQRGGVFERM